MVNRLQQLIYNLGNVVPLALMTALAWFLEFKTLRIPIILVIVAIIEITIFYNCFKFVKSNCSVKNINVSKIISKDSWIVAYVITYISQVQICV